MFGLLAASKHYSKDTRKKYFRRQKRYRKKIRRENNYTHQLAQLSDFHKAVDLNYPSIKLMENESWLTDSPNLRYKYFTENSRLPHKIKKSRLPFQIIRERMPKKIEYSINFKFNVKLSGQSQVISVWPQFDFQDHTFSSSGCNQLLAVHCVQPLLILTVIYTRFYI